MKKEQVSTTVPKSASLRFCPLRETCWGVPSPNPACRPRGLHIVHFRASAKVHSFRAVLENMTATTPEQEDYTGEDGLLYCGKCHKPKEAYFPEGKAWFGFDRHPAECDCQRTAREEREAAEQRRRHLDTVEELKHRGFTDSTMRDWTFEKDNGRKPRKPSWNG
jgi:hypothetical protein